MATTLSATQSEFRPKTWEEVPCPLCSQSKSKVLERFGYQHRYTYRRCVSCLLAYQSPRPVYDSAFVETAYEVYTTEDPHWKDGELTASGRVYFGECENILKEAEALMTKKSPRRLLEVGSNTGFFLKAAKDLGWSESGVEISRTMVNLARKNYGVNAVAGNWLEQDFNDRFDFIFCSHVIEHIPDPASWMRRFLEVLSPGGVLCISVPNMQSIDRKFKRFLKRIGLKKDRWEAWRTPDHLYEPCERSLVPFFHAQGFELIRTYTYPSEWMGDVSFWHRIYHFGFRWGAKQRYYLKTSAAK